VISSLKSSAKSGLAVGRSLKVDYRIIIKLADAIQHNLNITDAYRYAGVSRDTLYRHLNSEQVFAEKMATAKENQNKLVMSFLTVWWKLSCFRCVFQGFTVSFVGVKIPYMKTLIMNLPERELGEIHWYNDSYDES